MKTNRTPVTGDVSIWAVPRSEWEQEHSEDKKPFSLSLYANGRPYTNGAVKLVTEEVTVLLPDGIDMVGKAIETLRERRKEIQEQHEREVEEINRQINQFLQLTHQGDDNVINT